MTLLADADARRHSVSTCTHNLSDGKRHTATVFTVNHSPAGYPGSANVRRVFREQSMETLCMCS